MLILLVRMGMGRSMPGGNDMGKLMQVRRGHLRATNVLTDNFLSCR